MACHQQAFVGAVLRLRDAAAFARQPVERLVRGFQKISETGLASALDGRDIVDLSAFADTSGEAYTRAELEHFGAILNGFFRLPTLRAGEEAVLGFELDDHLRFFDDWPMLSIVPRTPEQVDHRVDLVEVSDFNIGEFVVEATAPFGRETMATLAEVARLLRLDEPPRAWLIWENSD